MQLNLELENRKKIYKLLDIMNKKEITRVDSGPNLMPNPVQAPAGYEGLEQSSAV